MDKTNHNTNAPMNTLLTPRGASNSYNPKFHPLPGEWAKKQMESKDGQSRSSQEYGTKMNGMEESAQSPRMLSSLQKALASEASQHSYWEKWQGVTPGKAVFENPRELQNTLLPSAKYGTEGQGYG